ncbi:MAG: hypothetical protein RLZ12_337 [Bacillota bacterium]
MDLHELKSIFPKKRKRVGRGCGSGLGKTCGRGQKGQKSRSGGGTAPGFEGGQFPLYMRLPKRGFVSRNRIEYKLFNVGSLNDLAEVNEVTPLTLKKAGKLKNDKARIKILGVGEITRAIKVKAHKFSSTAERKIIDAGGTVEVI